MTVSELNQPENLDGELIRLRRPFYLMTVAGLFTMVAGIFLQYFSQAPLPPNTFLVVEGAALLQLVGAFLIYRNRVGIGLATFAISAPLLILFVISQTAGIGILMAMGTLLLFLILVPQVLVETRQMIPAQVAASIVAGLLIIADLYWPVARPEVADFLFTITAVTFLLILFAFGLIMVRQFRTFGLRGKLISTTLFVAILAVVAVAVGVNSFTRNALTTEVGEQLQALTESQAILIGELFYRELTTLQTLSLNESLLAAIEAQNASYGGSEAENVAQILALDAAWVAAGRDDPERTAVLENSASAELKQFTASFPENSDVLITDQFGALVAATSQTPRYYLADEVWWQDAYNIGFGATYFSEPDINKRSGIGFIDVALPLFSSQPNGSRAIIGILHATYSLKALEDLMVNARFGDSGEVRLHFPSLELSVNEAGRLEIHQDDMIPLAMVEELLLADQNFTIIDIDQERQLFSIETVNTLNHQPIIDALNWHVSVRQTEAEALAAVLDQQRLNIILGLIVVLVASGAAAFVGRQLTEPILRLTAVAQKVTAGELDAQAQIDSQDEIGVLANAFNTMTAQVKDSIHSLEHRVQNRTRALETSIEVGRRLSTIRNSDELVKAVVDQVRDAFNYYHAHIYLLDEAEEMLIMAGGTGVAGQKMLAQGHKLAVGQGLVGQAALANKVVLVPDVSQVKEWLPNPLLPDTKAEIAVPITLGDRLLGVLDVQQNQTNSLQQEDADVLLSITGQVAIALENARLVERLRKQAETDAKIYGIGQQIQATNSVEEAMQIAIRELGRATNAKKATVQLVADDGNQNGDSG